VIRVCCGGSVCGLRARVLRFCFFWGVIVFGNAAITPR